MEFYFEGIKPFKLMNVELINWLSDVIKNENKLVGEIVFIFCSDSYLLQINNEFLNHDYFTDIITFDYVDGDIISGDIFISYDRVLENSSVYETIFDKELYRVIVHGVLHLIGYNDKIESDQLIMREKEDYYLATFVD